MTTLEGSFYEPSTGEFPSGTYFADMAQPMANKEAGVASRPTGPGR